MPFSLPLPDTWLIKFMLVQSTGTNLEKSPHLDDLREAIRANRIHFPVPVPIFPRQYRADVQWRLAELYLVHGWRPERLAQRYGISCTRVRQSVRNWVCRARTLGYLQPVSPSDPPTRTFWDTERFGEPVELFRQHA
jgi:hypothetical protein